ncbi:von Willebrand factor A domain-containing protein 1-like [Erpetoichthys calabaricus]|uniref:von Willebrand factor A domain-containing protein 1 n=1 Tax=Erpetoichthys calabaricus TaxID=27687 RepID=A0A8C4S9E9_ERPCA|nr:von Willebrand factor A domain-containing protein 1-like [Erpetoichthys calabaricus]
MWVKVFVLLSIATWDLASTEVTVDRTGYCKSSEASTDLIFLLDSSSSITPWEFTSFLSVFKNLVSVLNVGPNHVQIALVSVSDLPVLEFSFQQHTTVQEILSSLSNVEQRMGSTNSGLALKWVYEIGFTKEHGSRDAVQKTVVWVTDGLSTDDVAWPAKVLRDAGILVLVVSTGRSSHGIQNVATSERAMFFVDTDKLLDLVVDLCVAVVGSAPLPGPNMRNEIPDIAAASWQQSGSPFKKQNSLDILFNRVQSDIGASSQMNESHNMTRQSVNISVLTSVNTSKSPIDTSTSHLPVSPRTSLVSESGSQTLYLSIPPSFHSRYPYQTLFHGMPGRTIGSKGGVASLEVKAEGKEARVVQVKANSSSLISTTSHFKQGAKKPYSLKSRTFKDVDARDQHFTSVAKRYPPPQHLMLTDVTFNRIAASWAEPEDGQAVRSYKVRHIVAGMPETIHTVPSHVKIVFFKDLRPRSDHLICVAAVYKRGKSAEVCKKQRTHAAPTPQWIHSRCRIFWYTPC